MSKIYTVHDTIKTIGYSNFSCNYPYCIDGAIITATLVNGTSLPGYIIFDEANL